MRQPPYYALCRDVVLMLPAKCASGSLKAAACRQLSLDESQPGAGSRLHRIYAAQLAAVNYPRVAALRDPVDRLVSCWRDKVAARWTGILAWCGVEKDMTWDAFVDLVVSLTDEESDQHFRSYSSEVVVGGRRPDHVLRVNRLAEDWADLEARYGWPRLGVPRINEVSVWSGATHKPTPTPKQLEWLRVRYRSDYELWRWAQGEVAV